MNISEHDKFKSNGVLYFFNESIEILFLLNFCSIYLIEFDEDSLIEINRLEDKFSHLDPDFFTSLHFKSSRKEEKKVI